MAEYLIGLVSRGELLCLRLWHLRRGLDDANSELHFVKQDKTLIALAKTINNTKIGARMSQQMSNLVSKSQRECVLSMTLKIEKHFGPWAQTFTDIKLFFNSALITLKKNCKDLMVDCNRSPLCLRLQLELMSQLFVLNILMSRLPERKLIMLLAVLINAHNDTNELRSTADFVGEDDRLGDVSNSLMSTINDLKKNEIFFPKTVITALGVILMRLRASAEVWMTDDFLAISNLLMSLEENEEKNDGNEGVTLYNSSNNSESNCLLGVNRALQYWLTSDIMRLELYLIFSLLLLPFDPDEEPQLNRILAMITQGTWAMPIFRDEFIYLHDVLKSVYRALGKSKIDRHWQKKGKELKTSLITAIKSAPLYRRQRRLYLLSNLEQYLKFFLANPKLIANFQSQLQLLISLCKLELQWIIVHCSAEIPRKKIEILNEIKQQGVLELDNQVLSLIHLLDELHQLLMDQSNNIKEYYSENVSKYDLGAVREALINEVNWNQDKKENNDNNEENESERDGKEKDNEKVTKEMAAKLCNHLDNLMEEVQGNPRKLGDLEHSALQLDVLRLQLQLLTSKTLIYRPPSCSLLMTLDNLMLNSEFSQNCNKSLNFCNISFLAFYYDEAFRKLLQKSLRETNSSVMAMLRISSNNDYYMNNEGKKTLLMEICPEEIDWSRRRGLMLANFVNNNLGRKFVSHFHALLQNSQANFANNRNVFGDYKSSEPFSACVALCSAIINEKEQELFLKWIENDFVNFAKALLKQKVNNETLKTTMTSVTTVKRRLQVHLECVTSLLMHMKSIDAVQILANLLNRVRIDQSVKTYVDNFCTDLLKNFAKSNEICHGEEIQAFIEILGPENVDYLFEILSKKLEQQLILLLRNSDLAQVANSALIIGTIASVEQMFMQHLELINDEKLRFDSAIKGANSEIVTKNGNNVIMTSLLTYEDFLNISKPNLDVLNLIKDLKRATMSHYKENFFLSNDESRQKHHYLATITSCFDLLLKVFSELSQEFGIKAEEIRETFTQFEPLNKENEDLIHFCKLHNYIIAHCKIGLQRGTVGPI